MTDLERAAIRLAGASDRHAPTKRLRREYVLARAAEIKRDLKRHRALSDKPLPLFEMVQQ